MAGALVGGALVALATRLGPAREVRLLAAGLTAAALAYLGMAIATGATGAWVAAEAGATLAFALVALAGLRFGEAWLATGWLLHCAWDVLVHRGAGAPGYAPDWYPVACVGFDLAVAAWLFSRPRHA